MNTNISSAMFNVEDLPTDLVGKITVDQIMSSFKLDASGLIDGVFLQEHVDLGESQTCTEVIGVDKNDAETMKELDLGCKLSFLAYGLPYFVANLSDRLHYRSSAITSYASTLVSESSFIALQQMEDILAHEIHALTLASNPQFSGFYIRTATRIWNKQRKRIYKIPKWENRLKLLNCHIIGNVNLYVLRKNTSSDKYECYVMFRGTTNEFNGIPQYGKNMRGTQMYSIPTYDPIEKKTYPNGSETIPLYFPLYTDMVNDAIPHIFQCLEWLHAMDKSCERILVVGHSMGACLVQQFCFILKHINPAMWDKCFFRGYGSPMICNSSATLKMEQDIIDSKQKNKYLLANNTDDFINVQYKLGGIEGLKFTIGKGINSAITALVSLYISDSATLSKSSAEKELEHTPTIMRIAKLFPEILVSGFLRGAFTAQITTLTDQKQACCRLGQRKDEEKSWHTINLQEIYANTLKLIYCKRSVNWNEEYIGKSHGSYLNYNMNILWMSTRTYENLLYRKIAQTGLKKNNKLVILPLFPKDDLKIITPEVLKYLEKFS